MTPPVDHWFHTERAVLVIILPATRMHRCQLVVAGKGALRSSEMEVTLLAQRGGIH